MYKHQPLSRGDSACRFIRINALRDSALNGENVESDEPISVQLCTRLLQGAGPFLALSYTWGSSSETTNILVNDRPMTIRSSLAEALVQIRSQKNYSWLWVDSICINQSDTIEKSWQVQMMSSIFCTAERVILWLGPEEMRQDVASCVLMDYVNEVGPRALQAGVLDLWNTASEELECRFEAYLQIQAEIQGMAAPKLLPETIDLGPEELEYFDNSEKQSAIASFLVSLLHDPRLSLPHIGSSGMETKATLSQTLSGAIQFLFKRPIWNRCWIIQEIGNCRDGTVLCGSHSASLDEFDATLTAIVYIRQSKVLQTLAGFKNYIPHVYKSMYEKVPGLSVRRSRRGKSHNWMMQAHAAQPDSPEARAVDKSLFPTLTSLLSKTGLPMTGQDAHYTATDPRDVIFAMMNVAKDADALGITADYTKSTVEVFTALARRMLSQKVMGNSEGGVLFELSPLTNKMHKRGYIDGLPSWVPNWYAVGIRGFASDTKPISGPLFNAGGSLPSPKCQDSFVPCGPSAIDASLVLRLNGLIFDTITDVMAQEAMNDGLGTGFDIPFTMAEKAWIRRILSFVDLPTSFDGYNRTEDVVWNSLLMGRYPYLRLTGKLSLDAKSSLPTKESRYAADTPSTHGRSTPQPRVKGCSAHERDEICALFQAAIRRVSMRPESLTECQRRYLLEDWNVHFADSRFPINPTDIEQVLKCYLDKLGSFLSPCIMNRTLFRTQTLQIGLAVADVREGDVVAVLQGFATPVLLRPKTALGEGISDSLEEVKYWSIVGDAYVDGIMHGEAVAEGKLEVRMFDII